MLEAAEQDTDELIVGGALLAVNLRAGVLETATAAQTNALMCHYAETAEKLAEAYRLEVSRRRQFEEEAKSGLYLQGAQAMAEALSHSARVAKRNSDWLEPSAVEKRLVAARRACNQIIYSKIALSLGCAAAAVMIWLYAYRQASFYSLAGSLILVAAACPLIISATSWLDLTRRYKAELKWVNHWSVLSASEAVKAEEEAAKRAAYWAKIHPSVDEDWQAEDE